MSGSSIAFIDTSAQQAAVPYYGVFPNEPIPPAGGTNTILVAGKTFDVRDQKAETLLDKIVKNVKPGGSILIVSHGNDAGLEFKIGDPKNNVQLQLNALDLLRQNAGGKLADDETAKGLGLNLTNFAKFKAQMIAVQKLQLDRVDLRACNIGRDPKQWALSALQVFFNCNTLCAPKIYDAFGIMKFGKPNGDANFWRKWMDNNKGALLQGAPPNRFAWHTVYTPSFQIEALSESNTASKNWIENHLPPGNYSGGPLFYHAFTNLSAQPIFAGESGFRSILVEAYKGKEPSRTIDVNNMPLLPE